VKLFREIRNLIAFLTAIPVGMDEDCLTDSANHMYLFPLVGAFIGALAGAFAWLLHHILDDLIAGFLTLGFILLITGLNHADGLLDFGDGIMFKGPPDEKIRRMQDQQTGVGGFALGFVTFLTTSLCIAKLAQSSIIQCLISSEVSAKLAMVFMAWLGKSAHGGMNTVFINAMHGRRGNIRLAAASSIALSITVPLMRLLGFAAVIAGLVAAAAVVGVSNRHFRGLTGDCFGAGNELARLSSLLTMVVMARWA